MKIVKAKWVWVIYGDYDSNAPDTANLSVNFKDEASAAMFVEAANKAHFDGDDDFWETHEENISCPFIDGWQFSLSFDVHKILVPIDEKVYTYSGGKIHFDDHKNHVFWVENCPECQSNRLSGIANRKNYGRNF